MDYFSDGCGAGGASCGGAAGRELLDRERVGELSHDGGDRAVTDIRDLAVRRFGGGTDAIRRRQ